MEKYIHEGKLKYFYERCRYNRKPITADIFLTNFCNLDCGYCRYKKTNDYMDFELFKSVVERLREMGVLGIVLTGGGEPLINPDIGRILQWLDINGVPYGINTNGVVVPEKLIGYHCRWVKFGVDHVDPGSYWKSKGANVFEQVINNILKLRRENHNVKIGVQAVIESPDQIDDFVNYFFGEKYCNYISIRPIESQRFVYAKMIYLMAEKLNHAKTMGVNVSYKWKYVFPKFETYRRCHGWWTILNISFDGQVNYCCNKPLEKVGSIFESNIMDKIERYPTKMGDCEIPCRKSGINDYLRDLKPVPHVEFC
jgi:MoaA/NifB/PqqE/SkfB family radical SAM enzyme